MRRTLILAATLLAAGCERPLRSSTQPPEEEAAARLLARADDLARDHDPREARALYARVLRRDPGGPTAARALYGLARLQVEPGPLQDYRGARATFDRLLTEHPWSPLAREAVAWRAVLKELERSESDRTKLQRDLERLKELDLEQEQRQ